MIKAAIALTEVLALLCKYTHHDLVPLRCKTIRKQSFSLPREAETTASQA